MSNFGTGIQENDTTGNKRHVDKLSVLALPEDPNISEEARDLNDHGLFSRPGNRVHFALYLENCVE